MTEALPITLTTNIGAVPGVGARRATAFRKLGIRCVADLIRHLPVRWEHERAEQTIASAGELVGPNHGAEANVVVRGEVATMRSPYGRRPRVEATLEDSTGTVLLTWFNASWMRSKLHPGTSIRVIGKASRYGDYLQMVNPRWEAINVDDAPEARGEAYQPVYPATEDLSSRIIADAIAAILEPAVACLEDHLHEAYRAERALPTLADAYRMMHQPADPDEWKRARRRLALDELLMLQLGVMLKRRHRRETLTAPALRHTTAIDEHITQRFPFALTADQRTVIDEIVGDLTKSVPMNRLLQGDVGAGKTVVALYAMLLAVASEHQGALMAPTALLAEQHHASITRMLEGSRVRIELLTSSLKAAERRGLLERLEAGAIDVLVGTHALLTESVNFKSLAVVVIDEQHRFGVHQRAVMRTKANEPRRIPHTLVMTATPIPRTMSLTVFGDLDISTIRHLPPGRQPIITKRASRSQSDETYAYVNERIGHGDQAYVVVPAIDESDTGMRDVGSHVEHLESGPLRGRRLAAMHGRLSRTERDDVMQRFRDGAIDVLVATTVIEVGVDVPNASIMVVENADRFGLAQLHQLRGRVGRGSKQSLCVLIADPVTEDGEKRIAAIVATNDGFEIAERDLEIRGPGELFGSKQSGMAPFMVARIPGDTDLLRLARRDATAWVKENPTLSGERDALLKKRLLKAHGDALGLGDVG